LCRTTAGHPLPTRLHRLPLRQELRAAADRRPRCPVWTICDRTEGGWAHARLRRRSGSLGRRATSTSLPQPDRRALRNEFQDVSMFSYELVNNLDGLLDVGDRHVEAVGDGGVELWPGGVHLGSRRSPAQSDSPVWSSRRRALRCAPVGRGCSRSRLMPRCSGSSRPGAASRGPPDSGGERPPPFHAPPQCPSARRRFPEAAPRNGGRDRESCSPHKRTTKPRRVCRLRGKVGVPSIGGAPADGHTVCGAGARRISMPGEARMAARISAAA
jgi:hypothetical protein